MKCWMNTMKDLIVLFKKNNYYLQNGLNTSEFSKDGKLKNLKNVVTLF